MIACFAIPYFAAAVERRNEAVLQHKPLAIGGQPWEARPVYAFSQEVAQRGVTLGMSLRLVQVLSPHSHFMPAAKTCYSQASGEVIDVLTDFCSLIEPQELWHPAVDDPARFTLHSRALPARYCLDLDGLPAREAMPLVQEVGRVLRQKTSLAPAVGVAAHKFTAQVAAAACRPSHALPVEPGADADFLAPRPLGFLPLEKEVARRLRLLGIQTFGEFAGLPLARLREQFGPEVEHAYRLARGEAAETTRAEPVALREEARHIFEPPVENLQALKAVGERAVAALVQRLQEQGRQARRLRLVLVMGDDTTWQEALSFRRPTADRERLALVLRELLAQATFTCGVAELQVVLSDLVPAEARQLALFGVPPRVQQAYEAVQALAIKHRGAAFYRPVPAELTHPLPERRFRLHSFVNGPTHEPTVA